MTMPAWGPDEVPITPGELECCDRCTQSRIRKPDITPNMLAILHAIFCRAPWEPFRC